MGLDISRAGFRGLARQLASGKIQDADQREAATERLIQLYGQELDRADQVGWVKAEHPALFARLEAIPKDVLVRASTDRAELGRVAADLQAQIGGDLERRSAWREAGLSPSFEDRARRFHAEPKHSFLTRVGGELRFEMPEVSFRPLITGRAKDLGLENGGASEYEFGDLSRGLWRRHARKKGAAALKQRLVALGVKSGDVDVGERTEVKAWAADVKHLQLRPLDAALLLDAYALEERSQQLAGEGRVTVRRVEHEGRPQNVFEMPAEKFLGMRGVRYGLPDKPDTHTIAARCRERLQERGVDAPQVRLIEHDGVTSFQIPTDQARVLVAPIASGDPATRLSLNPMDNHDARAKAYDPELGVFLTQCALLAYEDQNLLDQVAERWGLTEAKLVDNKDTDAQGFTAYDPQQNAVVVSFRGTESKADALVDADIIKKDAGRYGDGEVHGGFKKQMDSICDEMVGDVRRLLAQAPDQPPPTIVVAGHSLGGALGAMFAGMMADQGLPVGQLYTCGQPKVGDDAYNRSLAQRLEKAGAQFYRYVNNSDIVTRVPPSWDHCAAGLEVYFDRMGRVTAPNSKDRFDKLEDRFSAATLNLISGNTFESGVDGFEDHRCHFYVGFCRKNRDVDFS